MVKPNDTKSHSAEELVAKAKAIHLDLVNWGYTMAERTMVIAIIQSSENSFQTILYLRDLPPPEVVR